MKSVACRSIAALCLGLAALLPPAAAFGPPQLAYRSGNVRIAAPALRDALDEAPDDAELHARLGITYAMMGEFPDAAPHFGFALGSITYEQEGWRHHADTLRALGQPEAAYAMRAERLLLLPRTAGRLATRCDMIDDLRAAGRSDEALALAELTLALHPYSDLARALRLEVALDRGDEDADAIIAWMNDTLSPSSRTLLARSRAALLDGDLPEARAWLETIPPRGRVTWDIIAQEAELRRRAGEPEEALWLLTRPLVNGPNHPELLAARARTLVDLGRGDEAAEVCALAVARYPRYPAVAATSEQLKCP